MRAFFDRIVRRACAAGLSAAFLLTAVPAPAAVETDPAVLYQTMQQAYQQAADRAWAYADESYYFATILDAGRAYSLFRPNDPHYGELAELTVDIATRLRYNPLTNDDAALWYVREAAQWVIGNDAQDADRTASAKDLLARADAFENPAQEAQMADDDALAVAKSFRADADALVQVIIADVRAYQLTGDVRYRSSLLQHAADIRLPLLRVPGAEAQTMFQLAAQAEAGVPGYTPEDIANGKAIEDRRARTPALQEIAYVSATPHSLRMTRTAPADEYFGSLKFSPIGIDNEIVRLGKYLDAGWGARMAKDALELDEAVEQWQHVYPRDMTLPKRLFACREVLVRVGTPETDAAAQRLKDMLLIEYTNSKQARELSHA